MAGKKKQGRGLADTSRWFLAAGKRIGPKPVKDATTN